MRARGGKLTDMKILILTYKKLSYKSMSIVSVKNDCSSATFIGEKRKNSEKRNSLVYGCLPK